MVDAAPEIWSATFTPYACLKDVRRTTTFRQAIRDVVSPGDVVVDAGSGTGILSFFAAEAGAARVYALEINPVLVDFLQRTIERNGLGDRIEVVAGDATAAVLPAAVDVVICELIDTGLMEEMQVEVLNALRTRGVIGPRTKLVPNRYSTFVELVDVDDRFYGFRMAVPKHEWPSFTTDPVWYQTRVVPLTDRVTVAEADFGGIVETRVAGTVTLTGRQTGRANAVRIGGMAHLAPGTDLGATDTINGDKVLDLPEPVQVTAGAGLALDVSYVHGGGLSSLRCELRSS
jgi:protein arginine N-methyltransferase 1